MKATRCLYLIWQVSVFNLLYVNAQIDYEIVRNTDTIIYYVINPYGDQAEYTWTIEGGVIAGHSSPYTADGADTIPVIWDDTYRTSANYGSLKVSVMVSWPGGISCPGEETEIRVESWVRHGAISDTSAISICPGKSFILRVDFEGKPSYQYKWKLYEKDNPGIIVEDHTDEFIYSLTPSADIVIAAIENNSNTEKLYVFEITEVRDGLHDGISCDVSMATVTINVQPKQSAGSLKSTNFLIRR